MRSAAIVLAAALGTAVVQPRRVQGPSTPMSFSNRLLLNRAAVNGVATLEVMLAVEPGGADAIARRVERVGGRVGYTDAAVGYLRVDLPIERLLSVVDDPAIAAYQIASQSRGSWYRDGPPQSNAEMYRGFETVVPNPRPPGADVRGLPVLSPTRARDSGYTGDEDSGIREWIERHPTFDGRGVTIALLESAQPEFASPILGTAKALDGRDVPKLAGIVNTIGADQSDDTRVRLDVALDARTAWNRIGDRTYAVPRPGRYRFGLFELAVASSLVHRFGVLQDEATREVWVDANGNADFRDEAAVADVNERFDARRLKIAYPRPADVAFVIARGPSPGVVHLYLSRGGHQTMTLSIAAGSTAPDSLGSGVAPGARVLLIRNLTPDLRLRDFVEGYLEAARRPDVDLLCDSAGIVMVPDTAADFVGLIVNRLIAQYGKPIFHSAGNMSLWLGSVSALGDAFSVGGSLGPQTFALLYGGARLRGLIVHPVGAAGPSIDGLIKPDFLAPVHRVAADLLVGSAPVAIPKNAPTVRLPEAYQISCCTSASAPYAAGIGAVLLSAAKQRGVPYSYEAFSRALRVGARFLPASPAHDQGNGVLDVAAAWTELTRRIEIPQITSAAAVVHPLADYAVRGSAGAGIFERDGWSAGTTGTRVMRFRRESGAAEPGSYGVSWTGNDGTFTTVRSLRLPLGEVVSLPIRVSVRSPGAHSAILNLHDPATGAVIFRTQATIVAAERFAASDHSLTVSGTLPLMEKRAHYIAVPPDIGALDVELRVVQGTVRATVLPSHGLYPNYYGHLYPQGGRTFTPGIYHVTLPNPAAGVWTLTAENTSAWREPNRSLVSTTDAEYAFRARLLSASLRASASTDGTVVVATENRGAALQDAVVTRSIGTIAVHRAETLADGLPNQFAIDVPPATATLALRLRGTDSAGTFELYVYDCSTGECFSYNFTLPAATRHTLVVRHPRAGRWIAAVNAAPVPHRSRPFELETILAAEPAHQAVESGRARQPGETWTNAINAPPIGQASKEPARVLLLELLDRAVEHNEFDHPWETRAPLPRFADRPVAVGMSPYRFP